MAIEGKRGADGPPVPVAETIPPLAEEMSGQTKAIRQLPHIAVAIAIIVVIVALLLGGSARRDTPQARPSQPSR